MQNLETEAKNFWVLGKELGASFVSNDDEEVEKLIKKEKRDHKGWAEMVKGVGGRGDQGGS